MKLKKLVSVLLVGTMIVSLAACGKSGSSAAAGGASEEPAAEASGSGEADAAESGSSGEKRDSITIALSNDPNDLAPNDSMADGSRQVAMQIYDRLCYFQDGEIQYRLATSIEQTDDTHITIALRDDVNDSEGNHFTASDVIYSIEHCKQTSFASIVSYIDLDNSEIIDDYNLVLALTDSYILQIQLFQSLDIFDEDAYNNSPDGMVLTPVGYGPYVLESYTSGSEAVLTARDDYYLGEPQLKTLNFEVISETSQRTNALISGDIDIANYIQVADIDYINEQDDLKCEEVPTLGMIGMCFNVTEQSVCQDINLRKAVAYAIDAASIVSVYYSGHADVATDTCSVAASSDYFAGWDDIAEKYDNYYARDLEKAKEYLAEAGYPDGGITLKGILSANSEMAAMVQAMLSEIGITLELAEYDDATCISIVNNEKESWDIFFTSWLASSSNSVDLLSMHLTLLNGCGWSGPDFDTFVSVVREALTSMDQEKQQELSLEAHDMASNFLTYYAYANTKGVWGNQKGLNIVFSDQAANLPDYFLFTWE